MKNRKGNLWILGTGLGAMLLLYGCLKPDKYPDEPALAFEEFKQHGDSGEIRFSFTDGDGDIGLSEEDTEPPFDTGSRFYNNVFIRYFEKVNGAWVQGDDAFGNPVEFTYRTEKLTPTGKNKALKGDIIIYLTPIFYDPFSTHSDTIKFDIQMADRALHLSNIVESGEIIRE